MINARGHIAALESILVFTGWMILLAYAWTYTQERVHTESDRIVDIRAWNHALFVSDTLIRQHGQNPWNGCAEYSEEKRRVTEYRIQKSCLEKLEDYDLLAFIKYIRTRSADETVTYVEQPLIEGTHCATLIRPIFLDQTKAWLEVVACEN